MSRFDISIPILIEKVHAEAEKPFYRARPVFFAGFERSDPREDRAIRYLRDDLRKALAEHATAIRHEIVAQWSFCPPLSHRRLDLNLSLRKRSLRLKIFVVLFEALDRTLAVSPQIAEVIFECATGDSLTQRAEETYTEHFRYLEKSGVDFSEFQSDEVSYAHLDAIELSVNEKQVVPEESDGPAFAMLGEQQAVSGEGELERVGRCLNRLHPNDLQRALCRDPEVDQLESWWTQAKEEKESPSPLLIVGANQVGKTSIIHEWVFRMMEERERKAPSVWLLSPQRLISGMSFVGQWEQRLLAILEEAAKRQHILYFDDLIGLFHAGKSRDSNLTVGQILKLHMEEGRLSVLAEITPSAWRKIREVDRSFADLFTVVHLREPSNEETLRVLIRTLQDLEQLHDCRFEPDVLPLVIELPRRFIRGRAFPGKGAEMLRQLAATHPSTTIGKDEVYRFFEHKTGISQAFMDRHSTLSTAGVRAYFEDRIVGQEPARETMVDAIVLAKAQLNDPGRPVASLLFLGPTGVGKTECAKTLAGYYFGSSERLLRFDMNEYNGWDAVPRLIGTFGGRQGTLTGSVRRRPHSVILLDEIEKAHPDVFDLLLQVLDDGRLTDANGVTTDFCNAIIILTSNLGAQEARSQVGFGAVDQEDTEVYVTAARKFFRPEFFNRLDRVVPFHELGLQHIQGIVRSLVSQALKRQGLHQRQLSLSLDPQVYDFLARLGFNQEYGARALRRAVEDHLVEPLGVRLSSVTSREPAFIRAVVREERIQLSARTLSSIPVEIPPPSAITARQAAPFVRAANLFVKRLDDEMDQWSADDDGDLSELDKHYFLVREELVQVRHDRDRLQNLVDQGTRIGVPAPPHAQPRRGGTPAKLHHLAPARTEAILQTLFHAPDTAKALEAETELAPPLSDSALLASRIASRAALVDYLAGPDLARPDRMLLRFRLNTGATLETDLEDRFELYRSWIDAYIQLFKHAPGLNRRVVSYNPKRDRVTRAAENSVADFLTSEHHFLYGEGPGFHRLLEHERGLELFCFSNHTFEFGGIEVFPLRGRESVAKACRRIADTESRWMDETATVSRVRHEKGWVLDFKTGILTKNLKASLWTFLLPLLEKPPEFP